MRICLTVLFVFSVLITACAPVATNQPEAKLRVITEAYPPYNFIDKNGNVAGQGLKLGQLRPTILCFTAI